MRLTYETGTATLIQFIAMSFLNIANGLNSVVTTCHAEGKDCISNMLASIIFFMLVVAWFAFIWVLGYAAQERRSKRIALILIGAEGMVALVAYVNIHGHPDWLSLFTSILDLILALWIIFLAFRIVRADGKRIRTRHQTGRRRKRKISV